MGNYNYNDYRNLALYINTSAMNDEYMSFQDGVIANGILGTGLEFGKFGWQKGKTIFSKKAGTKFAAARKKVELRQLKGKNVFQTVKNAKRYNTIVEYESKLPQFKQKGLAEINQMSPKQKAAYTKQLNTSRYYDDARKSLKEAKTLRGAAQAKKIKEFEQKLAQAKLNIHKAKYNGNLKPTNFLGKAKNVTKTVTGMKSASRGIKTLAANSSKFRFLSKFVKGNALMTGISVAMDYGKFVETKQKCGAQAMRKEIAKSTGVALAESVGFLAGMKAGAALGTAVGSVFPGVGNIVGGVAGALLGGLVSWGAGKLAHKAMGKSEIQKHEEKQSELLALKAKYNLNTRVKVVRNAAIKVSQEEQLSKVPEEQLQAAGLQKVDKAKMQNATKTIQKVVEAEPEIAMMLTAEAEEGQRQAQAKTQVQAKKQTTKTQTTQQPQAAQPVVTETTPEVEEITDDATEEAQENAQENAQDSALSQTMSAFVSRINGTATAQPVLTPWTFGNGYV